VKTKIRHLALLVAGCLAPVMASATNGYFAHGYGIKAKGMAGVGIALPQDGLAAATNPAGIAFLGNRVDLGVEIFSPLRSSTISGNSGIPPYMIPSLDGSYSGTNEDRNSFLVPEFGYNRMLNPNLALGLAVYGNGGMNTSYARSPFAAFGFSSAADKVSNVGSDSSAGWGVRVGWTGQVSDALTMGATYQSKTQMGKFDKYAGLFAEQGSFDIPANYGIGAAFKASPRLTLAADVQRIEYGGIASIANPVANLFRPDGSGMLGGSNGAGFGWRDMTVFKLGVAWKQNDQVTFRAGYSTGRQPIPAGETFFNILAPGVIEQHLTLGMTWQAGGGKEISAYYMHAFSKNVNGSNSIPQMQMGGGEANLRMHQNALGFALGWRI